MRTKTARTVHLFAASARSSPQPVPSPAAVTNGAAGGGVRKGDTVDATGPAGKPSAGRLNPIDRLVRADREDREDRSVTVVVGHGTCDDGVAVEALETDSGVVLSASVRGGQGEPAPPT
ncbi:hypothetical protein V1L54_06005 [Streptomyces sp. TRM 70361]|uniref:hypothetical protein n=1 Tax=Streptomyces sp. TRM 70361 TaxID=3116553 RepID=UPI002E7B5EA7|nr:hypothetical protein [Streptomyces sp. TRM 70361]MEE1938971.1 hypothetical protein [Streptomyces sp. TRM 70361]